MKVFLCILLGILIVGIVCIAPCVLSSRISREEEKRELEGNIKEKE